MSPTTPPEAGVRDQIVFIGVAQEKAKAFSGTKVNGRIKLCLNGHEWAKRQLEKRGIGYEALDNGFLSCTEPEKLQQICGSLGPEQIV
jgi:hypothetical protein